MFMHHLWRLTTDQFLGRIFRTYSLTEFWEVSGGQILAGS